MTSGDIKQYITKVLFNMPEWIHISGSEDPEISKDLLNINNWKRESKFKFKNFEDFNDKSRQAFMEDFLETYDCHFGNMPKDNTEYTFRLFTCYGTDAGDWTLIIFTDSKDEHFIYSSAVRD